MSVLLIDSFDDGLLTQKWTQVSGTTVVTVTNPRTGTHSVDGTNSSGGGLLIKSFAAAQQHNTFIVGMGYFQVFNAETAAMTFLNLGADLGVTTHFSARRNNDGSISVYRGGAISVGSTSGGTLLATSAPNTILIGNWYHIEIKVFLNDATGTIEVRVNNTVVINFVGDTKNAGTAIVFDTVRLMSNDVGDAGGNRMDDVYILNGAGATNNNFIGDSRIHNLLPNGNGFYSELIGSDGNSVNNYLQVDETPPNTTDYNGGATSGDQDSYAFPDLPVAVTAVRAVAQRAWAASSDAGSRAARNFVRIAGVDFPGVDYNVGATYLHFETLFDVSPATAVAFTPAEFNAAEWGFEVRA